MDYQRSFEDAIGRLKAEGRYRTFANLERDASRFPMAMWRPPGEEDRPREVTVWCSNDYLGMGGHRDVIGASTRAARAHGAGAGGTRNISGTHNPIIKLEAELAIQSFGDNFKMEHTEEPAAKTAAECTRRFFFVRERGV